MKFSSFKPASAISTYIQDAINTTRLSRISSKTTSKSSKISDEELAHYEKVTQAMESMWPTYAALTGRRHRDQIAP